MGIRTLPDKDACDAERMLALPLLIESTESER